MESSAILDFGSARVLFNRGSYGPYHSGVPGVVLGSNIEVFYIAFC